MSENAFCASHLTSRGDRECLRLDYRTGKNLGQASDNEAGSVVSLSLQEVIEDPEMPQPLFDLKTFDSPTNIAIRSHCNLELLAGEVECIERPGHLIFSHYQRASSPSSDNCLNNVLTILDRQSGSILFTDIICHNSSAVVPENFFVQNDMLFFVHERTTLTAIGLR